MYFYFYESDQEVQDTKIVSYEADGTEKITVTLSEEVTSPKFYVNGTLIADAKVDSAKAPVYVITATDILKENKENTLRATDSATSFDETVNFNYIKLNAPSEVGVAETVSVNKKNKVNAANVTNAKLYVKFDTLNADDLTVEFTVKGKDKDKKDLTRVYTTHVAGSETEAKTFENLSEFADGKLSVKARVVKEDTHTVSVSTAEQTVTKSAEAPILTVKSVNRSSATQVKIGLGTEGDVTSLYYLVKDSGEAIPTVEQVLSDGTKATSEWSTPTLTLDNKGITDAAKAYVVYLVAQTKTGTNSTNIVAAKVAKNGVDQIEAVTDLQQIAETQATFKWNWNNEDDEPYLVGYRVELICASNTKIVSIDSKETKQIDLFDAIKELLAMEGSTGNVKVNVYAVADNIDKKDSNVLSATFTPQPFVSSITTTLDKTTLSWIVAGNTEKANYTVKVIKYNADSKNFDDVVLTKGVGSKTSCDILTDLNVESYGLGSYIFTVVANPAADVLATSKESTKADHTEYYVIEGIKDLEISKVDGLKVTLTGTLLPTDDYELATSSDSNKIVYELYYKAENGEWTKSTDSNVFVAKPYEYDGDTDNLLYGETYSFTIATKITNNAGSTTICEKKATSDVKCTFDVEPITATLTYKDYEKSMQNQGAVIGDTLVLAENNVTYKDNVLYLGLTDNKIATYKAEDDANIAKVIELLKQMKEDDTVKLESNKVTELELKAPSAGTTYDLTSVEKATKVEITGNSAMTTVKGNLTAITLNGVAAKFDLSGLTVTTANVNEDNDELKVAKDTSVVLASGKKVVTINDVKFTEGVDDKLAPVKLVANNSFETTGSTRGTLKVDSSKVSGEVALTLDSNKQKELEITASEDGLKVLTNTVAGGDVTVLGGKVDLSNNGYTFDNVTVKNSDEEKQLTVDLILDKVATKADAKQAEAVKTVAAVVITDSKYQFKATEATDAHYTVKEGSNVVTFIVEAGKSVTTKSE